MNINACSIQQHGHTWNFGMLHQIWFNIQYTGNALSTQTVTDLGNVATNIHQFTDCTVIVFNKSVVQVASKL